MKNEELFQQASIHIPGGVNSPVRAFKSVGGSPVFFKRGEGARKLMEVVTGQIVQEHHVLCAVEWTDHGQYETHANKYAVELGHRFDKCPQMTVTSHLEGDDGLLKLDFHLAEEQGLEATHKLLERVRALWEEASKLL